MFRFIMSAVDKNHVPKKKRIKFKTKCNEYFFVLIYLKNRKNIRNAYLIFSNFISFTKQSNDRQLQGISRNVYFSGEKIFYKERSITSASAIHFFFSFRPLSTINILHKKLSNNIKISFSVCCNETRNPQRDNNFLHKFFPVRF